MTVFAATDLRASELARCTRMAALRGHGTEPAEHDEQTKRYFARGHLFENYIVERLREKHGDDNVEQNRPIPWPLGTGHADFYIKTLGILGEVKSTVTPSPSGLNFEMAVWQLKTYLRFDKEAKVGALYMLNPSDLSAEDVYVVKLTDYDRAEIDAQVAELQAALDGGPLPDRVCAKPSQGRGRFCPFVQACFEGWEPPAVTELEGDDLRANVLQLHAVKREEASMNARLRQIAKGRKDIEAELAELVPPGEWLADGLKVTRSDRTRETFSLKAARAAGVPEHLIREHTRLSTYSVWSVTGDVAAAQEAHDYGSEDDLPF